MCRRSFARQLRYGLHRCETSCGAGIRLRAPLLTVSQQPETLRSGSLDRSLRHHRHCVNDKWRRPLSARPVKETADVSLRPSLQSPFAYIAPELVENPATLRSRSPQPGPRVPVLNPTHSGGRFLQLRPRGRRCRHTEKNSNSTRIRFVDQSATIDLLLQIFWALPDPTVSDILRARYDASRWLAIPGRLPSGCRR